MSDDRLSNLGKDLTKAKQQALLIEVLQSDLDSWADQSPNTFRVVCDASSAVYDGGAKVGKTNVLVVGEAEGQEPSSIFGCLLGSLDNEFDDLHKREFLKKLTGFGLNQAVGGVVGEAVAESLSVGAGQMMEYLAEWNDSVPDFLTSAVEAGVESVADESGEFVGDIGGTGAEAIAGQFSSEDSIYLSRAARKRLKELAPRLSDKATSHETLQLALEMLLVTAQGAPKVIVVKDPFSLDDASLALLAMLVSLEKDLRQANQTADSEVEMDQTTGVSVVLTFTGSQPNETVESKGVAEKQQAISRLRMMASRYSLLERLDTDIPAPAVRSSTFVGRDEELESLWQHWNRLCGQPDTAAKQTWCLIKGEPGTGKTALANRFIQQIRSDIRYPKRFRLSIPAMRMLNQTGHSAQATGLASLKNSLAEELRRLTLIHRENVGLLTRSRQEITEGLQSIRDDATSDDPEAKKRTLGRVGKVVSRLLGVDAAVGLANSVKDWSKQGEMRSMREEEFGQSSRANHKEEQFELLRAALWEIRKLAEKCTSDREGQTTRNAPPLLLLIDDLQWVDDFTAEFLLNEWPADMPVYILATGRGSDSFATTAESSKHQVLNHYRSRLFSELGIFDTGAFSVEREGRDQQQKEGEQKRDLFCTNRLELKGIDQSMLANLIKLTYAGIQKEQAEQFANGIIKNVSGENSVSEVITLFAIETLNVISDPQFYRRHPDLPQLIEPLLRSGRYRFREPDNMTLKEALNKIFKDLSNTYQASYQVESAQFRRNVRFNLPSYALLEERLHLIERYFGRYSVAVRYSLLLSGLLGSPFKSGLIGKILNDLSVLESAQYPELSFLVHLLKSEYDQDLRSEDYELLEQAFEIIRRLRQEGKGFDRYAHQHNLISQFLIGQLRNIFKKNLPTSSDLEQGIKNFVQVVTNSGSNWFASLAPQNTEGVLGGNEWEIQHKSFLASVYGFWYETLKTEARTLSGADAYSHTLNQLALLLDRVGRTEEALAHCQEAYSIRRLGYEAAPETWGPAFVGSLLNLASMKHSNGDIHQANLLSVEAIRIARSGHQKEPKTWSFVFASALNQVSVMLLHDSQSDDARLLAQEAVEISRFGHQSEPDLWASMLSRALHSLAWALGNNSLESVEMLREALQIAEFRYQEDPAREADTYVCILFDLGSALSSIGEAKDAIPYLEGAKRISKLGYTNAPDRWRKTYSLSLNKLAVCLFELGDIPKVVSICEEAVWVNRSGYEISPDRWAADYSSSLNDHAKALKSIGEKTESIRRYREALSISRPRYLEAPQHWGEIVVSCLRGLANACPVPSEDAYTSYKQALKITSTFLKVMPKDWAKKHVETINDLGMYLDSCGRAEEAIPWLKEALMIGSKGYAVSPEEWGECFFISTHTLARTFEYVWRAEDASYFDFYKNAIAISSYGYSKDKERWRRHYLASLNSLGVAFLSVGEPKLALPLFEKAASICRERYRLDSQHWEELFSDLIKNLAAAQEGAYKFEDALSSYKEALSISEAGYQRDATYWAQTYASDLCSLAINQKSRGDLGPAMQNHDNAFSIRLRGYESQPERWSQDFAQSLGHLGALYFEIEEIEAAAEMLRSAMALCWEGYQTDPGRWATDYSVSLKNLAVSLESSDPEQARLLYERAASLQSSHVN